MQLSAALSTSPPGSSQAKQRIKQELVKINVLRMLVFCLAFLVMQAVTLFADGLVFQYMVIEGISLYEGILSTPVWLTLKVAAVCLGVGFAVLFALMQKGVIRSPKTHNQVMHACLILFACLQIYFFLHEAVHGSPLLSLVLYILLLGVLPVLPRALSAAYLAVFALLSVLCFIALAFSLAQSSPVLFLRNDRTLYAVFTLLVQAQGFLVISVLALALGASWLSYGQVKKTIVLFLEREERESGLEAQVEQRTAELKEKARVAEAANLAKTRFLTRASHEMRTSMNTMSGIVYAARETGDLASKQQSIEAMDRETRRLKDIVENIIDTTKIELDYSGDDFDQSFALLAADAAPPKPQREQAVAPTLSGQTILVVDDLETNRFVLREFLRETQAHIEEAPNGKVAVEVFAASPEGYYSCIFMDLLMPEMNGHDATRAIRSLERPDATDIPIVAVSANAFKEDIEASLAAGMDAHITKPVDQAKIFQMLTEKVQPHD